MQINFLYIFFVLLHILYQMQAMIYRDPDTPVITTREFFGILTSISFKLCSFAPLILIYSIYYSIPQSFLTFTFSFLIFFSLSFKFHILIYIYNKCNYSKYSNYAFKYSVFFFSFFYKYFVFFLFLFSFLIFFYLLFCKFFVFFSFFY